MRRISRFAGPPLAAGGASGTSCSTASGRWWTLASREDVALQVALGRAVAGEPTLAVAVLAALAGGWRMVRDPGRPARPRDGLRLLAGRGGVG
jgi:hypothetical protein